MKTIKEIYRPVKDYEGVYEVSNFGNVRRILQPRKSLMKLHKTKMGRLKAYLCKNSEQKSFFAHRLVAMAFIPNPFNKPCINHKDGNPLNNYIGNLEWVTISENALHASRVLGINNGFKRGIEHKSAKLDEAKVAKIRALFKGGRNRFDLAVEFCVTPQTIYNVVKRRYWRHC